MKRSYWIIGIIVLVLIAGWFYWFELRPSHIRANCQRQATDKAGQDCRNVTTGRENGGYEACVAKLGGYESCLHEGGIKW